MEFLLSPGNDHDSIHAIEILSKVELAGSNVIGDRAYGTQDIRDFITDSNGVYTIPPKSNTQNPWECDRRTYKERHLIECFFLKIKWFRRVATRYDKRDDSFLAFVYLASIAILVK